VPDGTIEIITGRERRRRWGIAEKLTIVSESHESGACVAAVAARHDICPSLLHGWRRLAREGRLSASGPSGFVPVRLMSSFEEAPALSSSRAPAKNPETAPIEVILPSGGRVLIRHDARVSTLRAVIAALRG
jgi:transposase